jgi:hypothetical protein
MNEMTILFVATVASLLGGALGAYLSKAPAWKGALITAIASLIQIAVGELAQIEQPIVYSLIYLLAAALIGGRWGMGLTARQLALVVIGGFLFALVGGAAAIFIASPAAEI